MDWSLALISQQIESVIVRSDSGWGLMVDARDLPLATETIQRYRAENRGWWSRKVQGRPFSFHFGVIAWCLFLIAFYWMATRPGSGLHDTGEMDSVAVSKGAWWRLFTATVLHADLAHLTANLATGFCILGLAMGRFGIGMALLVSYLAGAAGNVLGLVLHNQPYQGLGASGMVMGALGLLATQALDLRRSGRVGVRYAVSGIAAAIMLFVLLGLDSKSDVAAHFGGLLFGLVAGGAIALYPKKLQTPQANAFAGVLLLGLFILTWALALK